MGGGGSIEETHFT